MLKKLYNQMICSAEKLPAFIEHIKTTCAEDIAIQKKKTLINSVSWTQEQQKQFDEFWLENYGKKISNKWHRLYQAVSGEFCVEYIPEKLYSTKVEPLMNDRRYAKVLEDKSLVEVISKDCDCVVPETVIVCSNGRFYDNKRTPIKETDAIEILLNQEKIVIKPTIGSNSGKGIAFIESIANKEISEIKKELQLFGNDYIVQKVIVQHPIYAALNPTSINTIRITTYILNGELHHFPIALRMGRSGKKVDNIHAGGLAVGVLDDGQLCPNGYELGYGNNGKCYNKHPDSNILFEGYRLLQISSIIKAAYKVHGKMSHIGIVSWDFAVDEKENPVLVEANITGQAIWLSQMIHGKGAFESNTKEFLKNLKK